MIINVIVLAASFYVFVGNMVYMFSKSYVRKLLEEMLEKNVVSWSGMKTI
jgi:hypothetical protein